MFSEKWKKEIITIPNILSLLRIALIPVYAAIYFGGTDPRRYLWAGKLCTTGLFVSLILLVLFPELPMGTVLFLTWVDTGFLLFSFCSYLLAYFGNRNCLTDWNQS